MAANAKHFGRVINLSTQPLWVVWDEGTEEKKVWKGKLLAAGRQTPDGLDIDGVSSREAGVPIRNHPERGGGTTGWWWLGNGAHVNVSGKSPPLYISVVSVDGMLSVVSDGEVSKWGVQWDEALDVSWGKPAK